MKHFYFINISQGFYFSLASVIKIFFFISSFNFLIASFTSQSFHPVPWRIQSSPTITTFLSLMLWLWILQLGSWFLHLSTDSVVSTHPYTNPSLSMQCKVLPFLLHQCTAISLCINSFVLQILLSFVAGYFPNPCISSGS